MAKRRSAASAAEAAQAAPVESPALASNPHEASDVEAPPEGGGYVDVWTYFAENIDEFEVAKAIVEHFEADRASMDKAPVDALGLYLRAKVTVKRNQVAYAIAQKEIEKASGESRSAPESRSPASGGAAADWARRLLGVFVAHPQTAIMAGFAAMVYLAR